MASRAHGYRFVLLFAGLFSLGQLAVVGSRVYIADWLVAAPAYVTLAAFYPADEVTVDDNRISSRRVVMDVLPGCEGTELFLLLAAGVLAFPASSRAKALGLALGLALAFGLNQLRVLWLYTTVRDFPANFELTHGYLAPTALLTLLGAFFWVWSAAASQPRPA